MSVANVCSEVIENTLIGRKYLADVKLRCVCWMHQFVKQFETICAQLFAGLLVNVDSLGDWISWIKYLSCVRYSLNVSFFGF